MVEDQDREAFRGFTSEEAEILKELVQTYKHRKWLVKRIGFLFLYIGGIPSFFIALYTLLEKFFTWKAG